MFCISFQIPVPHCFCDQKLIFLHKTTDNKTRNENLSKSCIFKMSALSCQKTPAATQFSHRGKITASPTREILLLDPWLKYCSSIFGDSYAKKKQQQDLCNLHDRECSISWISALFSLHKISINWLLRWKQVTTKQFQELLLKEWKNVMKLVLLMEYVLIFEKHCQIFL